MHVGSFCVSIIHPTPIWTTGSLTCVRDHYMCVYSPGLDTPTVSQHNIFDLEKLVKFFIMPPTGFGCLYHRFPKNVSQPFLQYSRSLSDALICGSANITNNQNTVWRMFVLVFLWRGKSNDCLYKQRFVPFFFFFRTLSDGLLSHPMFQ